MADAVSSASSKAVVVAQRVVVLVAEEAGVMVAVATAEKAVVSADLDFSVSAKLAKHNTLRSFLTQFKLLRLMSAAVATLANTSTTL